MVKTAGPLFGPNTSGPIRRRVRKKYPEYVPPPPKILTVHVTAGVPAPEPDCTGKYVHVSEHEGEHVYRRTTAPHFLIYWDAGYSNWAIDLETINTNDTDSWYDASAVEGTYDPVGAYIGFAIASEPALE